MKRLVFIVLISFLSTLCCNSQTNASEHYLAGKNLYDKSGKENYEAAINYFKEAANLDSTLTLAYAGLSKSYIQLNEIEATAQLYEISRFDLIHGMAKVDQYLELAEANLKKALELNDTLQEVLIAKALLAIHKGDYESSKQILESAYETDSTNYEVYVLKADNITKDPDNYLMFGADIEAYEEASQYYMTALELNPAYAQGYLKLGECLSQIFEYDKAEEYYNKFIELRPKNAIVYNSLGYIFIELAQYRKAISNYNLAIEKDKYLINAYLQLSICYSYVEEDYNREKILLQGLKVDPDHFDLQSDLQYLYNYIGRKDDSKAINAITIETPKTYEDIVLSGKGYALIGDHQKSESYFLDAIETDNTKKEAYHKLAKLYFDMGKYDLSLEYYEKFPVDSVEQFFVLSKIYYSKNKKKKAAKVLDNAINIIESANDHSTSNLILNSKIYSVRNKKEKALDSFVKAVMNGFVDYNKVDNELYYENIADDEKFVKFNKMMHAHKSSVDLFFKGENFYYHEKMDSALILLNQSIERYPYSARAYIRQADIYVNKLKDFDGAQSILDKGISLFPDSFGLWYFQTCVFSVRNETQKALNALEKALQIRSFGYDYSKYNEALKNISSTKEFDELEKKYKKSMF